MAIVDLDSAGSGQPLLMTAADVAQLLKVSIRTLWRLRSAGELPEPLRVGGAVRWRMDDLRNWIAEGCPVHASRENDYRRK